MLRQVARAAGLSHMTLYRAIRTGNLSAEAAVALGPVLEGVTGGAEPHSTLRAPFVIHGLRTSIPERLNVGSRVGRRRRSTRT